MAKSFQQNKMMQMASISSFALLVILLLSLMLPSFKWSDQLDLKLFQYFSRFLPEARDSSEIKLIQLPEDIFSNTRKTQLFIDLLNKLSNSQSTVGILSSVLPMQDYALKHARKNKKKITVHESTGILNKLARTIEKNNILLSPYPFSAQFPYQSDIKLLQESAYKADYLAVIPQLFLPYQQEVNINQANALYPYNILPSKTEASDVGKINLIWPVRNVKENIMADFSLALFAQHLATDKLIWQQGEGVNLQSSFINTDLRSQLYYSTEVSHKANTQHNYLSLEQALSMNTNVFNKHIILISQNISALSQLKNQLNSLLNDNTYITPAWLYMSSQGLLFVVFIYFIIVPKFHHNSSHILSLLFILLAAVTQYSLLMSQHLWLPLLGFYIFMILGHIVVQVNIAHRYKINRIQQKSYNALWKLGEYQFYQGDYEKSLASLIQCKTNDDVLALLYDIGQNFERRRQYDRAANVYAEINKRQKNYLDIKHRLHNLKKVTAAHNNGLNAIQASDTLVLPSSGLELPELGRYKIEKELGRGAMGVVYLGKDPKINRRVAIKTLNYSLFNREEIKAVKQRFNREAEAAGRLNHHNIVTVYDLGEEDDFSFMAMDFVQGKSLGEYTRSDKLLPINEVLRIGIEVAQTLEYAHSQNIVHRDIKPSNIMYNEETGQIKITDFGIARITDNVKTRTGSFMGSPSYMSPEQMTAQHVDGTSDIYALGVSLYQLLTGQLPYVADSLGNLAYKITHEKHRPIRDIREELPSFITRIINKALQKDPRKRYQTGNEMAQAIKRHLHN